MANILRRKVFPHDTADGDSSTAAGKWAAVATVALGLVALYGVTQVIFFFQSDSGVQVVGTPVVLFEQDGNTCRFTAEAELQNALESPIAIGTVSISTEDGLKLQDLGVNLQPGESTAARIDTQLTFCPEDGREFTHSSMWVEFFSTDDPELSRSAKIQLNG